MTIEEINKALENRTGGKKKLAEELGVSYDSLRLILAGNRPLTEQLSKHIEYVLNKRKLQTFVFTVDLPEGTVQRWVPGFDTLTEEEKRKSLQSICKSIMHDLATKGANALTETERAELAQISGLTPEQAAGSPPLVQ